MKKLSTNTKIIIGVGVLAAVGAGIYFLTRDASASQPGVLKAGETYKLTTPTAALAGDASAIQQALDFAAPGTFQVVSVSATADTTTINVKMLKDLDLSKFGGYALTQA
jgi:hypothetical protein